MAVVPFDLHMAANEERIVNNLKKTKKQKRSDRTRTMKPSRRGASRPPALIGDRRGRGQVGGARNWIQGRVYVSSQFPKSPIPIG